MRLRFVLVFMLATAFSTQLSLAGVSTGVYRHCYALLVESGLELKAFNPLWRMDRKDAWRHVDKTPPGRPAERRIKMKTNIQRMAGQVGGADESADPAPPLVIDASTPNPANIPLGTYWFNSGNYGYYSETINSGLRGGARASKRFEVIVMHRTPDGRVVEQTGGYADPDSSRGWDLRGELQPREDGSHELVFTQGAMELPTRFEGARKTGKNAAKDLPEISKHNYARSRHIFTPIKFENGKLYLMDEGSILEQLPNVKGDWISVEKITRPDGTFWFRKRFAHGYGENFIPLSAAEPNKMWSDGHGYPIRIFDEVTEQLTLRGKNGRISKIPSTTRSIAYRMDPKNPSKKVLKGTRLPNGEPADAGIVIMSEEFPGEEGVVMQSAKRMMDVNDGVAVERRVAELDGSVTVTVLPQGELKPASLVEGFNSVPGVVTFPSGRRYYLGTFSASEYTAGATPEDGPKKWRYGVYLGFIPDSQGPLGRYTPVTRKTGFGRDLADLFEEFTEMYGLSWGVGRGQIYQDEFGRWWIDVHAVDIDVLPAGSPTSGYPKSFRHFADHYRRHKLSFPLEPTEVDGMPWFEIDDPVVKADLIAFREYKAQLKAAAEKNR